MKTRNELRRDRMYRVILMMIAILVIITIGVQIVSWVEENKPLQRESRQIYYEAGGCSTQLENPFRPQRVEQIRSLEIDTSVSSEYDYDYVCRVVMAETGGEHNEDLTLAVCQAIVNTARNNNWTPEEVCINYKYTRPHEYVSDYIQEICDRVFISGEVYEASGNATVFYNPHYGYSAYHESQTLVCEIGGVRFFEEVSV